MTTDISSLLRANIAGLKPYSTARDEYKGSLGIFLDANENPYQNGYNRYPSPSLKEKVRSRIAAIKGVKPENLFMGNGSDEAIDLCYRVFCEPRIDNAISIAPSYGMYGVCADINDVEFRTVPLGKDFSLPVEELLKAADEHSKLMFLCSPNNPSANAYDPQQLLQLVERFNGMVIVDEAYVDFSAKGSLKTYIGKYPNLIVLQTLSKAYGLAGLRVGLAIADKKVVSFFKQVKYPYSIGVDTLSIAEKNLEKDIAGQIAEIKAQRDMLARILPEFRCVEKVYPSDANFLLVKVADARELYNRLISAELIVRDRSTTKGCEGCLRITVGTPEENKKLIDIISDYDRR
ncbi:MAG: histidinol-phosphate transaminase [Bacteroidales bacterium]|nr:histidinol-phosphate transaminase [Bacteroidales bacterium]